MMVRRLLQWLVAAAIIAVALWLSVPQVLQDPAVEAQDNQALLDARAAGRSDVQLYGSGRVTRLLQDDNEGSRHQRFIVEIEAGFTVLLAHNIDLAPRVPLKRGDLVRFYGEYEWNSRGGVIHWTHHDPRRRHPDGWIELDGKRYQ